MGIYISLFLFSRSSYFQPMSGDRNDNDSEDDERRSDDERGQPSDRREDRGGNGSYRERPPGDRTQREGSGEDPRRRTERIQSRKDRGRRRRSTRPDYGRAVDTNEIAFTVGAFLAVALGITLGYLLFYALVPTGGTAGPGVGANVTAGVAAAIMGVGLFTAPLVALVTGISTGFRAVEEYNASTRAAVSAGAGALAGYFVEFVLLISFAAVLASGGAGVEQIVAPAIGYGFGVGLTGALGAYFAVRF